MSDKIDLTGEQVVAGNISDFQQSYQIFYYPKERSLVDKIAMYIYLNPNQITGKKQYAKRSIYFSSINQLKGMIINLMQSYFYLINQRIIPEIPISEFRKIKLNELLSELRTRQLELWQNGK